jgi:energy-converting hydrogenase Eha subunit B
VQDNEEHGIECKTSSPDIEDNLIQGNGWGIYCWYGASPGIRWNTLVEQKNGGIQQYGECFSEITGNVIVQYMHDGIVIGPGASAANSVPRIKANNLISKSTGYAIRLNPVGVGARHPDVGATENYWGSGSSVEIEAKIYDGMDTWSTLDPEYYHARVVFEPFAVDSIYAAGVRLLRDSIAKSLPSKGTSGL